MHFCLVWNMESCMSLVLLFNICAISYALKITPKRRMRACVCVREKPCRVVEKHAKAAEQMKRKWEYNGSSQFNVFLWFVEITSPARCRSHFRHIFKLQTALGTDTRHTIHTVEIWHWHWMPEIVWILIKSLVKEASKNFAKSNFVLIFFLVL